MSLKATSVTDDDFFPDVVVICLAECNARVVWLLFEIVDLARRNVVRQETLGCPHHLWVIRLTHGEVVCQLYLEALVSAVVRQKDK